MHVLESKTGTNSELVLNTVDAAKKDLFRPVPTKTGGVKKVFLHAITSTKYICAIEN